MESSESSQSEDVASTSWACNRKKVKVETTPERLTPETSGQCSRPSRPKSRRIVAGAGGRRGWFSVQLISICPENTLWKYFSVKIQLTGFQWKHYFPMGMVYLSSAAEPTRPVSSSPETSSPSDSSPLRKTARRRLFVDEADTDYEDGRKNQPSAGMKS